MVHFILPNRDLLPYPTRITNEYTWNSHLNVKRVTEINIKIEKIFLKTIIYLRAHPLPANHQIFTFPERKIFTSRRTLCSVWGGDVRSMFLWLRANVFLHFSGRVKELRWEIQLMQVWIYISRMKIDLSRSHYDRFWCSSYIPLSCSNGSRAFAASLFFLSPASTHRKHLFRLYTRWCSGWGVTNIRTRRPSIRVSNSLVHSTTHKNLYLYS